MEPAAALATGGQAGGQPSLPNPSAAGLTSEPTHASSASVPVTALAHDQAHTNEQGVPKDSDGELVPEEELAPLVLPAGETQLDADDIMQGGADAAGQRITGDLGADGDDAAAPIIHSAPPPAAHEAETIAQETEDAAPRVGCGGGEAISATAAANAKSEQASLSPKRQRDMCFAVVSGSAAAPAIASPAKDLEGEEAANRRVRPRSSPPDGTPAGSQGSETADEAASQERGHGPPPPVPSALPPPSACIHVAAQHAPLATAHTHAPLVIVPPLPF